MASSADRYVPPKWVPAALVIVAIAWTGLRIVAPTTPPPLAVVRAFETVRVMESPESGRFELRAWPEVLDDLGLADVAEARAAGTRLDARVQEANEILSALLRITTSHVETLPDGPVGLRLAGSLVPFAGADGERLTALTAADPDRGVETLSALVRLLDARLGEPPPLSDFDETVRRREMTRLHRQVRDALQESREGLDAATAQFRTEATAAVQRAGGPFLRRGRGVVMETLLMALLGVLLREAARRRRPRVDAVVSVCIAPAAALGGVIALAGSVWLPRHPVYGLTSAFVAFAFAVGWLTPGVLAVLSRLERLFSDEAEEAVAATPATKAAAPTPLPPPRVERPPTATVLPRDVDPTRAPFFRRRR